MLLLFAAVADADLNTEQFYNMLCESRAEPLDPLGFQFAFFVKVG